MYPYLLRRVDRTAFELSLSRQAWNEIIVGITETIISQRCLVSKGIIAALSIERPAVLVDQSQLVVIGIGAVIEDSDHRVLIRLVQKLDLSAFAAIDLDLLTVERKVLRDAVHLSGNVVFVILDPSEGPQRDVVISHNIVSKLGIRLDLAGRVYRYHLQIKAAILLIGTHKCCCISHGTILRLLFWI